MRIEKEFLYDEDGEPLLKLTLESIKIPGHSFLTEDLVEVRKAIFKFELKIKELYEQYKRVEKRGYHVRSDS